MSTNSASKKVKFVASDPSRGGLPVKRKQVQQACDACRRKKRRCIHADDAPEDGYASDGSHSERPSTGTRDRASASAEVGPEAEVDYTGRRIGTNIPKTAPARFVGDLNPEGMFIEVIAPDVAGESAQKGDVGVWLPSSTVAGDTAMSSQFITARPPAVMDQLVLPFVKEHYLTYLPPEEDFQKLHGVFIQKIHPIFPVVPISQLTEPANNPTNIVLRQLVCLAACSDPEMAQYLRLKDNPRPLSPQEYSHTLSSSIRAILETSLITDRVLHIRALTILSLYTQPTCAEEADLPAELGGRAIHHIQTLGLHLLRYDATNCDDLNSLFCAVWAIDRINAAVYGRPCLIHERDVGRNFDSVLKRRPPAFRLLLNVVIWLDRVIELYRPGPSAEANGAEKVVYIDLPVLEAMIVEADALSVPSSLIATIETLYHAVIILSCRLPRPGTKTAASTLPPPSANARRSLAAERIACAVPRDCLSPVPFVPYAVSLALSVEYRKMRHSRLPMFQARAMNAFRRNCELLRPYKNHFWSANVLTGLGERVLKEMGRAATTISKDSTPPVTLSESKASSSSGVAAAAAPPLENPIPGLTNGQPSAMDTAIDSAVGFDSNVNFSVVDPVSGQDVFGHIDPNFNLDAVEDALEANLDIGLPFAWGDWSQYAS